MFLPERSSDLDQTVRADLASSLRYLTTAGRAALHGSPVDIEDVCREIERHRVEPSLFARYYELVLALKARRDDEACLLHREIDAQARRSPRFRTVPFGGAAMGAEAGRYSRWLNPKKGGAPLIDAPDPRNWARFETNVEAAFDLVDEADPALGTELRNLIVEVVGVSPHIAALDPFGGASTFMLWGTIFANVDTHPTRIDIAGRLVHEGAHQLLFGLSCREPLVANALSERYASPLRADPRPVIGIYHATLVCARMHHAFTAMLRPYVDITGEERRTLEAERENCRRSFGEGRDTLCREGDLTGLGQRLLDEATAALERSHDGG